MKRIIILSASLILVLGIIFGCSDKTLTENGSNTGRLVITAFDAPPPEGIEHLFLNVVEVSAHHEDQGWLTLNNVDTTIDFLELINGVTVVLVDDTVPSGYYSQLRLVLSDTNQIVVNDITHPLTVPSGTQTGVKLNLDFEINNDEFVNLYIDFDVSKSVVVANESFKLKPTYRVFKEDISGTISGNVTDTLENPLENVVIEATGLSYSTSTLTDEFGNYLLTLPFGLYEISAALDANSAADTTYTGIALSAGDNLTGFDFVIK